MTASTQLNTEPQWGDQLWDKQNDNVAILTHAFVVRWTSPLETGNYVPKGKPTPENLTEGSRRTEPGPQVQLSIAFDCKLDDSVHRSLTVSRSRAEHVQDLLTRTHGESSPQPQSDHRELGRQIPEIQPGQSP